MEPVQHLSVSIHRSADQVYKFAGHADHLHEWAAGLAGKPLQLVDGKWVARSPMGEVTVEFAPENDFGVLDHVVTLPSGDTVLNPLRVLSDGLTQCDVVFTVRQRDMSDEQFAEDLKAVQTDLNTLKNLSESR